MSFMVPRPTQRPTLRAETRLHFRKLLSPGRTMSAAQSETTLEAKLEALQCHFTWDLVPSRSKLFRLRDKLEDIGTEEGYSWLGHIYNLQGYIHYQLGSTDDARSFFSRAAEAFCQMRNTVSDEGPWLVVNYGNQAWLHYHQGERAESQACLSKVDALTNEYPSPSQDELHPEIYAEKAWTLMKFGREKKLLAAGFFQRAIRMQPDMVEWQTSHILALVNGVKHSDKGLEPDILEKMRIAKEHDPENLYLAALYLEACAAKRQKIEDEARELARGVLKMPVSSYSGIKPLLKLYRMYISMDEAIDLAEEALERHPDERYLKRCAAICYKMRIFLQRDSPLEHSMMERAISLYGEVISLYPDSSLKRKISFANIHAQSGHGQAAADQIYEELLNSNLDPKGTQMLYNYYAKHLQFMRKESHKSIEYHMRAAAIPQKSFYRENSISILERIRGRNRNRMCGEIEEFLANLRTYNKEGTFSVL
ncbi:interferon-induced protein with tetratricopeptide repeats 1-like [Xiphias gladius]|uniref:interferon-induced protein with tetratricopeptide repeats 1-like n=1 Tax=Xiphias gladius TaxID=8245 RepID=UPI001A9811AC|nr:interferon-induced protein with tetratricopeptide repeats 1-like [Xiphias gladius]